MRRQGRGNCTLAAAGEDYPVPVVRVSERGLVVDRQALLTAGQLRGADDPAEPPVPLRISGEDEQVPASRIGNACPRSPGGPLEQSAGPLKHRGGSRRAGRRRDAARRAARAPLHLPCQVKAELSAEHGAKADTTIPQPRRCLRELRHSVHAVVIGDGQHGQAARHRLEYQVRRARCPVQEAIGRMAVQLGPGWRGRHDRQPGHRPERVRRTVRQACPQALVQGGTGAILCLARPLAPGQAALELAPWHWRVIPSHACPPAGRTSTSLDHRNDQVRQSRRRSNVDSTNPASHRRRGDPGGSAPVASSGIGRGVAVLVLMHRCITIYSDCN